MFWNKKQNSVAVAMVELNNNYSPEANIVPELTPVPCKEISLSTVEEEGISSILEWMALSRELGITQRSPSLYELKIFCREEGIQIYNTQKVWNYLRSQSKTWGLFPLREKDCVRYPPKENRYKHAEVDSWVANEGVTGNQYDSPVPIPALLTVKKLVQKFGDDVYFLIAATKIDPFLVVVLRDSSMLFVERWDEPSFRG